MLLAEERKMIAEYGKKLIDSGLTTGTGGNISIFNRDQQLMAITPSGVPYHNISPEDVAVLDLNNNILDSNKKPSSEYEMHKIFYEKRKNVTAVVHTHSVYATTIACLNWELPAVHYLIGYAGSKVPLAKYATFGTKELAKNAYQAMGNYNAVLLANHGLLAVGKDIDWAFNTAEEIEFTCQIYYQTKTIGEPVILSSEEMKKIMEKFDSYGQIQK
ncbi:class II aldolase/adducin family protein [Petrotoga mobilis SJ95]|jgi:L-fuculose-phosphate aldolase|uniref:Class II aldolase/adducin family protein n=2 Tax=Petrotoga TaxID=28236 RepID=A9BJF9_PETMO|nr:MULTISPECIES: L-fuculose-phosphate aldolase [Petrotoga]ABX31373.1 class II aldolase/adducin family protein [Petrotoga mobilis SJ95]POZ92986.1 fuculose phosphate aldolase [Petrotoga halophila DSM 16923]